jgi:hypothetical protein
VFVSAPDSPFFDPKISWGQILIAVSMFFAGMAQIITAVVAWRDLNWRIKIIEKWQADHEANCEKQDKTVDDLALAVQTFRTLTEQYERRFDSLERRGFGRSGEHR